MATEAKVSGDLATRMSARADLITRYVIHNLLLPIGLPLVLLAVVREGASRIGTVVVPHVAAKTPTE